MIKYSVHYLLKIKGFTLIELIIAIVVVGILSQLFVIAYQNLSAHGALPFYALQATTRAQSRMILLLGEANKSGINFTDPCTNTHPPLGCIQTTANITINGNTRFISTTGTADDGKTLITLTSFVTNHL